MISAKAPFNIHIRRLIIDSGSRGGLEWWGPWWPRTQGRLPVRAPEQCPCPGCSARAGSSLEAGGYTFCLMDPPSQRPPSHSAGLFLRAVEKGRSEPSAQPLANLSAAGSQPGPDTTTSDVALDFGPFFHSHPYYPTLGCSYLLFGPYIKLPS